jgi:hypothetical protein
MIDWLRSLRCVLSPSLKRRTSAPT